MTVRRVDPVRATVWGGLLLAVLVADAGLVYLAWRILQ